MPGGMTALTLFAAFSRYRDDGHRGQVGRGTLLSGKHGEPPTCRGGSHGVQGVAGEVRGQGEEVVHASTAKVGLRRMVNGYNTVYYTSRDPSHVTSPSSPSPPMIPPLPSRRLRLQPGILNRHPTPNAILQHSSPKQPPRLLPLRSRLPQLFPLLCRQASIVDLAQRFTSPVHAGVLALQAAFVGEALLGLVEAPGAVDGPVAEVAVSIRQVGVLDGMGVCVHRIERDGLCVHRHWEERCGWLTARSAEGVA